ncbi:MAG: FeoB-associated Cys-rich membrane protein [Oscillospiraceae bacterium]|nr:FeoB-associated Cys-rich membrane protein [Oscillospiraceae bacterium]
MVDILVGLILLGIFGGAVFYIVKAKKSGRKCIGCPSAATCGKNCCCGCKD